MPELSRFFGIVIRMFVEAGGHHNRPHFHAYYQDQAAVFAIDTLEILGGGLSISQRRLVEAWAEIHRDELHQDWALLQSGQPPVKTTTQVAAMTHPIHRVTRFTIAGPYTLDLAFNDGTEQRIDFKDVLHGPLFAPLQELATFNAVRLDLEVGTLVWPNGADFDPTTLHDWPDLSEELATRARAWGGGANERRADTRMEPTRP